MYMKIFFNDKPLYLCDTIEEGIQSLVHHDDTIYIDELNPYTVKTMIHEMQQPKVHAGIFFHSNFSELKNAFAKKFTVIQAAGGLVKNKEKKLLMILRRGKWDLPKGKLDPGEKLDECALREVGEETGLKNIKLDAPLAVTYHTYHQGTKFILKESNWYTMTVNKEQTLVPQVEEDILEIRWVEQADIPGYLDKSFPLISDVIAAAKQKGFISF